MHDRRGDCKKFCTTRTMLGLAEFDLAVILALVVPIIAAGSSQGVTTAGGVLGTTGTSTEVETDEFVEIKGRGGRLQRWKGHILNFSGTGLVLRLPDGAEKHFPVERVASYSPNRQPIYQQALQRLSAGAVSDALALFLQARTIEKREWRRREISSQIVRCRHALGDYLGAGEEFVAQVVGLDPESPFRSCVPLIWFPEETLHFAEQQAGRWLDFDNPWVQLLGASYLLESAHASHASATLEKL